MYPELVALRKQCAELGRLTDGFGADDWDRPTRCTDWDVRQLWTHVCWGLPFMLEVFAEEPPDEANTDRYRRWMPNAASDQDATAVARHMERWRYWYKHAEGLPDEDRSAFFHRYVEAYLEAIDVVPDRLLSVFGQSLRYDDSASVDVIEVGVHTLDLQYAVGETEYLDPLAGPIITDVLNGILGEKPQVHVDWDELTYVLTATGRRALTREEREALGPLGERFPVIA